MGNQVESVSVRANVFTLTDTIITLDVRDPVSNGSQGTVTTRNRIAKERRDIILVTGSLLW